MEVSLSAGEVGLVSALIGGIITPLVTVFWLLQRRTNDTIERLDRALTRSDDQVDLMLPALKEQVSTMNLSLTALLNETQRLGAEVQRQGRILDEIQSEQRRHGGRAR